MTYPKYAEMKDSGVELIGDIPKHWNTMRLKFLKNEPFMYGANEAAENDDRSLPRYIRITDVNDDGSLREETFRSLPNEIAQPYILKTGDILFARSGATVGKTFLYSMGWGKACFAGYLIKFSPNRKRLVPKFIRYYTQTDSYLHFIKESTIQATIQNVSAERYGELNVPLPSIEEQQAIVNFLDDKTARIDELIGKKERQIELLAEKRQAVISEAVTKGLNRNVPLHDSGVKWLGEVPAHWEVKPLMHLTPANRQIMYGIVLPGPDVANGVPIVKGGDVIAHKLRLEMLSRTTAEIEAGYKKSRLNGGDIVYAIRGSIGMAEIVPTELEGANLTQDAARISPLKGVNRMWLLFALKSYPVFAQLDAGAVGATIRGINIRDLKRAYIPVPSTEEQHSIAIYLERKSSEAQQMADKIQTQINKLREYRQALITAAVTGKIDVRGETI